MKLFGVLNNKFYTDIIKSYKDTQYIVISSDNGVYDAIEYSITTRVNKLVVILPSKPYNLYDISNLGVDIDVYLYQDDPLIGHFVKYGIVYIFKTKIL